ncbi:hypothetical protein [Bacillus sp. EB01]|uniref:hypothetical protein n=1 Tax=Bacillus sp. EB01 TaxID=1347086 RepID=UPI0005C67BB5|nr:hypothetical protein [Bacillus sp. EB01]
MGKAFDNLLKRHDEVKKQKEIKNTVNKADKVRSYLNRIQKECEFKTAEDYERFVEISLELIEQVKKMK